MRAPFSTFPLLLGAFMALHGAALAQIPDQASPLWMRSPAISPDGQTIAFTYRGRIYTVDSAGGDAFALTDPQLRATSPVWALDGSAIAFSAPVFNAGDVYVAPLDGREIHRLTYNELAEVTLAVTPDGLDILFAAAGIAPLDVNFLVAFSPDDNLKARSDDRSPDTSGVAPARALRKRPRRTAPDRRLSVGNASRDPVAAFGPNDDGHSRQRRRV